MRQSLLAVINDVTEYFGHHMCKVLGLRVGKNAIPVPEDNALITTSGVCIECDRVFTRVKRLHRFVFKAT